MAVLNVNGIDFVTIQAAINAASEGDTIIIASGIYTENLTISTDGLTLRSATGNPSDVVLKGSFKTDNNIVGETVGEWIEDKNAYDGTGGNGIAIGADNLTIQNITIAEFTYGLLLGANTGLTVQGVVLAENLIGIYKENGAADVTDFALLGGVIRDGYQGMTINAADGGSFDDVRIDGTTFAHLTWKGIYVEQLSDAQLLNLVMNDVGHFGRSVVTGGSLGADGSGIELNLKYDNFANILISDFLFTDVGLSNGGGSPHANGAAIAIKARDDAPSYSTDPAALNGVTIENGSIDGTSTGIRIGEPGKTNNGPTNVNVANVTISDAVVASYDNRSLATLHIDLTGGPAVTHPSATGPIDYNLVPIANAVNDNGPEDAASIIVTLSGSDVDGTIASYTLDTLPLNGTLFADAGLTAPAATGTPYVSATLYFVPSANFNGVTSFKYTVTDNDGASDSSPATATITVNDVNDAPVANPVSASGPEDAASITVTLSGSDSDGTIASYTLASLPLNGTLYIDVALTTLAATGTAYGSPTLHFVPAANFNGQTSFTYTVTDNDGASDLSPATATIAVSDVNEPPVANPVSASGVEDAASITVTLSGSDSDGTVASYTLSSLPLNGTLYTDAALTTLAATGTAYGSPTLHFVPAANFNGQTSFTYTVTDNQGASDLSPATATITVSDVNDAPTVDQGIAGQSVDEDTPWGFVVPAEAFTDADGDPLILSASLNDNSPLPVWLDFDPATRTFSGTPPQDFNGTVGLKVTASDGSETASTTFTLTVTPVNELVDGGKGDDVLKGGPGSDTIDAGKGKDKLYGGDGDDLLIGGKGKDRIDGGDGIDVASYASSSKGVKIDLNKTKQKGGDAKGDKLINVENVIGSDKNDKLVGNKADNVLDGRNGNDKLDGKGGSDLLIGGAGKDTFFFKKGYGADTIADYEKGDTIDIAMKGAKNFKALKELMTETDDGVVIDFGGGDSLILAGHTIATLHKGDFEL